MTVMAEPLQAVELQFSSTEEGTEDNLGGRKIIWKDILREGQFAITPGRKKRVPFKVIAQGQSSAQDGVISMSDLVASFDAKAFGDVTIPDGHPKRDDSALNNTGYVNALRVIQKKGKHYLQGALGFTEPDVAAKVRRGSVPNVSSGIFFDFTRKADGKNFPCALNHVALTKSPWIDDLDPFKKVFASDDNLDDEFSIISAEFAEGDSTESTDSGNQGDVIWNEKDGSNWMRESLMTALRPDPPADTEAPVMSRPEYYVEDLAQSKGLALVTEFYKGDRSQFVIPFTVNGDEVTPAPATRWVEGKQALIAASDDFDDMTPESVIEKLGVKLSDMEGGKFAVESVTIDGRCRIRNTESGQGYLSRFVMLGDNVELADPADWERGDKIDPTPKEQQKTKTNGVTFLTDGEHIQIRLDAEDTPEARVRAARARRAAMLGSNSR